MLRTAFIYNRVLESEKALLVPVSTTGDVVIMNVEIKFNNIVSKTHIEFDD